MHPFSLLINVKVYVQNLFYRSFALNFQRNELPCVRFKTLMKDFLLEEKLENN